MLKLAALLSEVHFLAVAKQQSLEEVLLLSGGCQDEHFLLWRSLWSLR